MATVRLYTGEGTPNLVVPDLTDEDTTHFVARLGKAFADTGGAWMAMSPVDGAGAEVMWVPAGSTAVHVKLDGLAALGTLVHLPGYVGGGAQEG